MIHGMIVFIIVGISSGCGCEGAVVVEGCGTNRMVVVVVVVQDRRHCSSNGRREASECYRCDRAEEGVFFVLSRLIIQLVGESIGN